MGNSTRLTLCDARGPLNDLLEKLSGDDGGQWLDGLKRFLRKENPFEIGLPDINWTFVYEKLGMSAKYAEAIPLLGIKEGLNFWTVPVIKGITPNKVVKALKDAGVDVYLYINDLDKDVHTNDRDPNSDSYAISFKRTIEADEENKNLSANMLKQRGHKGITLLERLLLELGYLLTTGQHLDIKKWTLCSGSRYSDGRVPGVSWDPDDRRVDVDWCGSGGASGSLRSRSAVSLSGNLKD